MLSVGLILVALLVTAYAAIRSTRSKKPTVKNTERMIWGAIIRK